MSVYESYKKTKIDWLPSIPTTWSSKRIKNLFSLHDERNYKPLNEINLISLYTSLGVRQHSDIEHTTGNKARNADGYKIVNVDDIIVNILLCWMGAIGRSSYNGVTSPAYDVYTPHKGVNSSYYHYLFRIPLFSQQCFRNGHGIMMMRWRTYSPEFTSIVVPVPPREEQDQIVRFLDWKVSEINKLINIKRKNIRKLKEIMQVEIEKQLVLYPMVQSVRLKQIGSFYKGGGFSRDNLVDNVDCPAILYGDIYTQYEYKTSLVTHHIDVEAYELSMKISSGDIVLAGTGETKDEIGKPILYTGDEIVAVGGDVIVFHPQDNINAEFVLYQLYSQSSLKHRYVHGKGDIIVHIYPVSLGNTIISLPSDADQKKAVTAINDIISKVNSTIDTIEREIAVLKEFSVCLISDVVTGKIDVRGIEIPEYEYVDEVAGSDTEDADSEEAIEAQEE